MIKFILIAITLIAIYIGYIYSNGVYVSEKNASCEYIKDRFSDGLENAFNHRYKCNVSFKVSNLTNKNIEARYLVKNVSINSGNGNSSGSVQFNSKESGLTKLSPKESKTVTVISGSDFENNNIKIDAWINE